MSVLPSLCFHKLTPVQYQELFSVTQACSGPGSTKVLYCINLIHDGFLAAVFGFILWRYPPTHPSLTRVHH